MGGTLVWGSMYNFSCKFHLVPFHTPVLKIQDSHIPVINAKRSWYWEDSLPMSPFIVHFFHGLLKDTRVPFSSHMMGRSSSQIAHSTRSARLRKKQLVLTYHMHSFSLVPLSHTRNSKSIEALTFPALELQRSPVAVAAGILHNNPWAR